MKSTIDELLAFVSIVDSGSIVAAAAQLNQTTSGVSRALQRLEAKLNVTLSTSAFAQAGATVH